MNSEEISSKMASNSDPDPEDSEWVHICLICALLYLITSEKYTPVTCIRGKPKGIGLGIGSGVKRNQIFESALPPEPKTL